MGYSWGDHVGELELSVAAASERDVFADAVRAFGELLAGEDGPAGAAVARTVSASGRDLASVLADFLDELIFLAETEGFVPGELAAVRLGAGAIEARVSGRRGAPPHLVKAVTRHRLAFEPAADGWRANVLLDV